MIGHRFTDEQAQFAQAVRDFCLRECPPDRLREMTTNGTVTHNPELYRRLGDTGWLGLTIPEEYGGCGGTLTDVAILTEELSYQRLPVGGFLTTVIVGQLLVQFGTDAQKKTILPAVAEGRAILSVAITEPDHGSDAASIRMPARRHADGWRLSGQKMFTSNANVADWIILVTRTATEGAKHKGITLFCIPADREGIAVSRLETLGHIDTNITYYDDVAASDEEIIGPIGEGWHALVRGLNSERLVLAAEALGIGQRAFDDAVAYTRQRHQFGEPIARLQALQHGLAETATQLTATRLLVNHCAAELDAGKLAPMEASMAKLMATETAKAAALQGVQFMGGYGYMMEYEMQSCLRDAIGMTIFGGTSQIQKNIIADRLGLNR